MKESRKLILCLFSSTPDMTELDFVVKVLTGGLEALVQSAVAWGYDGIEFMPNPEDVPDAHKMETALKKVGAVMPVVNSGRMFAQGMALLHRNVEVRRRSIEAFKRMLDFAGYFKSRVGLGIARGKGSQGVSREEMDRLAGDVFCELTEYAGHVGAVVMLEPADPGWTDYVNSMDEAYGTSLGFAALTAAQILSSNGLGVLTGEWKHTSAATRMLLAEGTAVILASVAVLSLGGLF